jgi:Zn-finger nucleic acid-binding protein
MKQNAIGDITINECPTCRGMWFKRDDLDDVKNEVLPEMSWLEIDRWLDAAQFEAHRSPYGCPQCQDRYLTTIKDQHSEMEVSLCRQCEGTWLATGQFLYLINALIDEANEKSAPEYVKISLQQFKDVLMNPDAIVEEWHDLKGLLAMLKHRIFVEHPKLRSVLMGLQKSLPL